MKNQAQLKEPKQRIAFLNNYRAAVLAVMALLISFISSAQSDSTKYSAINGYGFKYKRMVHDSVFIVPLSTSPHTPYRAGGLRYKAADSTLQIWTGYQWNSIITGVGNGVDTAYALNDSIIAIETPDQDFFVTLPGRYWTLQGVLNNGSTLTTNFTITLQDSLKITSGYVVIDSLRLPALTNRTDTTTYKPLIIDASGNVSKMSSWPATPGTDTTSLSNRIDLKLNISDTTNKWLNDIRRSNDSVYALKNGSWQFKYKDSLGNALTATQVAYGSGTNTITSESAFTYNSATNKLTVDSIRSIKNIPDTIHVGAFESDAIDSAWFFGTSITAGSSATSNAGRYSKIVADQLRLVEMNFGHGGYLLQKTPSWPLTNTFMDVYTTDIPLKMPNRKYLFFAWGENDATNDYNYHTLFGVDTSEFKTDYKTVIDYAISRGWAKSEMRIISPFYQLTTSCPLNIQQNYYNAAKYFADSSGIAFIDVFTQGMNYNTLILTDYIHPGNFGHSLHADAVLKQMSQPLQIKPGENVVNQGTTVLNKVYHFGTDTATVGFQLAGINTDGTVVKVPSEKYLLVDNTNVPVQSGNASVLGNLNAAKQLRVSGANGYTVGKGFEFSYDGSKNAHMYAFDRDAVSNGNVLIDFGNLIVGSTPTSPFTKLYVNGTGFSKGLYSSGGPNVLYNSNDNAPTLNMLVSSDSVGHITTFGVSGYRPTAINATSTQPVLINTLSVGSSGAKFIVNGSIAADADSVTTPTGGFVFRDAATKKWKMTAAPITSINSQTGPSISISGDATNGITVSASSNTVTIASNTDLESFGTDANNTGTSETDLYSHTLAANKLTLNGKGVRFRITGTNNDATATAQIQGYFAGTNIFDSGALTMSAAGDWVIDMEIQRTSSTAAAATVTFSCTNTTVTLPVKYTALTSQDWTTTNIFKVTGTAGGGGGGSNDITAHAGKVVFVP